MHLPILTAILLVFIAWLNFEIHKYSRLSKRSMDNFWEQEKRSNLSRRTDISSLNYIIVTTEQLPMADHPDQTVNSYRDTVQKLSGRKIINLSGYTNTELKIKYGAANINELSEYDNNYTRLVSMLQKWAERLYEQSSYEAAVQVLEYAIACYTDVTKSYRLLADLYLLQGTPDKLYHLVEIIQDTNILGKEKLIQELSAKM